MPAAPATADPAPAPPLALPLPERALKLRELPVLLLLPDPEPLRRRRGGAELLRGLSGGALGSMAAARRRYSNRAEVLPPAGSATLPFQAAALAAGFSRHRK